MKRLAGALMSICPDSTGDFQAMMDGYDEADQESCLQMGSEKKRRLSADQVKALEKNFEVENKLEPERKARLAEELGLQPRQVAVWFQNRRARWKTKQLERDYGALKADYDRLRLDFEKLHRDNQTLIEEIRGLKSKAGDGGDRRKDEECKEEEAPAIKNPSSSDSCDSSAVLNDGGGGVNAGGGGFQFQDSKVGYQHHQQEQQLVKIEEHNFFGEESCSTLFSEYQAPSLHWDEWS